MGVQIHGNIRRKFESSSRQQYCIQPASNWRVRANKYIDQFDAKASIQRESFSSASSAVSKVRTRTATGEPERQRGTCAWRG
eukprot:1180687-Prorocentrum_minimum.AAC.1